MFTRDTLLLLPILAPMLGALLLLLNPARSWLWPRVVAVLAAFLSLVALVVVFNLRQAGTILQLNLLHVVDYGLSFRPSFLGVTLAVTVAALWFLASIFAVSFLKSTHSPRRFFAAFLLSMGGCVGVFLANDYFTFFVFFELMTFAAYPLVVHAESDHARRAGDIYLYMSVAGGLVLLFGILLLVWATGTAEIAPKLHVLLERGVNPYILALMFLVGFGLKMGLVPLHIWLPYTYVSAPAPATAMLSGAMNKTGVYGLVVFLTVTLANKSETLAPAATLVQENIGLILLGLGLVTMLMGGFLALMQSNIKRLLAYSSISQMGYIVLALASAMYLTKEGGLAHTAAIFHAFNHALFSTTLFFLAGVIYLHAGSLLFDRLGGLARFLPFTAIAALIASLSVLGLPGFAGFGSKILIHKALVTVAEHGDSWWLLMTEKLFVLGSAITAAYFIKLYLGIFFGKFKGTELRYRQEGWLMRAVLGVLCCGMLLVGMFPGLAMRFFSLAAEGTFVNITYLIKKLATVDFWTAYAFGGVFWPFALGIIVFVIATYCRFFAWKYPKWLSVEALVFRPAYNFFLMLCCLYATKADGGICDVYDRGGTISGRLLRQVKRFDDLIDEGYEAVGHGTSQIVEQARQLDQGVSRAYREVGGQVHTVAHGMSVVDAAVGEAYEQVGKAAARVPEDLNKLEGIGSTASTFSLQNVTIGSLIVAVILLIILTIMYIYGGQVL
ncbi:MAG: Hydrogenase-4 component B [Firmicutes bacterium]|nr:Hydrogenase-4 component B [Bacillota bacterium]